MPSPFPGMDPYLESPATWPDVHQRLITYISENLQPQLRPKYIARIGERVQLTGMSRHYVPDVLLVHTRREPKPALATSAVPLPDEPQRVSALDNAYREPYVEVVARDSGEVVTLIEVLGPANKTGDGRSQYLQKQESLMDSAVNLVEIDLLGYGEATTLARNAVIVEPADWRYLIGISRAEHRGSLDLYAVPLRERLPNCRIPLRPPDPDAVLDLTAVLSRAYETGSYDLSIDYTLTPAVPLSASEAAWLEGLLVERGLRPA